MIPSRITPLETATVELTCPRPLSTQERDIDPIPRLHPVYLPYRTQHHVLTAVQSILEECCFDFGNSWIPELMSAQKWEQAESIELTQWVKRFSKCTKSLPLSATRAIMGKSLKEVLFATSSLRHSAVHRLPTSAAGILKMLDTAITFTEALNDTERATQIRTIKEKLAIAVEDIIQRQTLLECKLSDQLKDFTKRRAEIDELERLAVEDMLYNDKLHRNSAGSVVEDLLADLKKTSHPCTTKEESVQESDNPNEVAVTSHSDLVDKGQRSGNEGCEENECQLCSFPAGNEGGETTAAHVADESDFTDRYSYSGECGQKGTKEWEQLCSESRGVDKTAPIVEHCSGPEISRPDDTFMTEHVAASGKVVPTQGIEDPRADEVAVVVAHPSEPDHAGVEDATWSATLTIRDNAALPVSSRAIENGTFLLLSQKSRLMNPLQPRQWKKVLILHLLSLHHHRP